MLWVFVQFVNVNILALIAVSVALKYSKYHLCLHGMNNFEVVSLALQ